MVHGASPGSLGLANSSGWMTNENCVRVLVHFISKIKCSKEQPAILFLDNHDRHVNVEVIDIAKENGLYLITFPPHCSHRLQPLDVAVYGPF